MRLRPVRFTVPQMMVGIATLAVSWCMCLGIGHLSILRGNIESERYDRETAVTLEKENKAEPAAEWRARAAETERMNRESWAYGFTALSLTGLGFIAGGLGLAIKRWYGSARAFAAACSTIAKIMLAGLTLGAIAYLGIMLLAVACAE